MLVFLLLVGADVSLEGWNVLASLSVDILQMVKSKKSGKES